MGPVFDTLPEVEAELEAEVVTAVGTAVGAVAGYDLVSPGVRSKDELIEACYSLVEAWAFCRTTRVSRAGSHLGHAIADTTGERASKATVAGPRDCDNLMVTG